MSARQGLLGHVRTEAVAVVLIVLLGTGALVARVLLVERVQGDLSLSRYATAIALKEQRHCAIGSRVERDGAPRNVWLVPELATVDVMYDHEERLYYSSKPPALSFVLAGFMSALATVLPDPRQDPIPLNRVVLLALNGAGLLLYLLALWVCLVWLQTSAAARLVILAVAALATFVTTFGTIVVNHVPAAYAAAFAMLAALHLTRTRGESLVGWIGLGLACGGAATLEIPALALFPALLALVWRLKPSRALVFGVSGFLLGYAPFFLSSAMCFGRPLFFFTRDERSFEYEGSYWLAPRGIDAADPDWFEYTFHFVVGHHGFFSLTPFFLLGGAALASLTSRRLGAALPTLSPRLALLLSAALLLVAGAVLPAFLGEGLDTALPIAMAPAVALSAALLFFHGTSTRGPRELVALCCACVSLPVTAFYVVHTDNWGGITSGPRWLLWLTPLWLLASVPVVERLVRRPQGALLLAALALLSLYFALEPGLYPLEHPILYRALVGPEG